MQTIQLSNKQARRFLLEHQGLGNIERFEGKPGIMAFIRRVGCIQYDPLNIVGRNPELVLQARIDTFRPEMLQELLYADRLLVDGMDKVMSIYPVEDWPYFRRFRESSSKMYNAVDSIRQAAEEVRTALESRGPLSSGDLPMNDKIDWPWGPTRLSRSVLESMYFWGELIVHHKKNNNKVYDFAHRHLEEPHLMAEEPNPTEEQYLDWRVYRRIGAIGFLWERAGDAWIGITGLKAAERKSSIERLLMRGDLTRLQVEGVADPLYARTDDVERLNPHVLRTDLPSLHEGDLKAKIIAPLDNLLWDRRMVRALFGFEYTWEVYKPLAKRDYGYYVLPVLYGDTFIARFEPGRNSVDGSLIIKNWWWEPGVERTDELTRNLKEGFKSFMRYLGAESIQIDPDVLEREHLACLVN